MQNAESAEERWKSFSLKVIVVIRLSVQWLDVPCFQECMVKSPGEA